MPKERRNNFPAKDVVATVGRNSGVEDGYVVHVAVQRKRIRIIHAVAGTSLPTTTFARATTKRHSQTKWIVKNSRPRTLSSRRVATVHTTHCQQIDSKHVDGQSCAVTRRKARDCNEMYEVYCGRHFNLNPSIHFGKKALPMRLGQ